jgi:uncharacterized membrane protein YeaQ/YmgE (transglycosylase-associated protein family)
VFWLRVAFIGLVAGGLAQRVTRVRGSGCLFTVAIGALGAIVGGIAFNLAGITHGADTSLLGSILVAFVGAAFLLLLVAPFLRRR